MRKKIAYLMSSILITTGLLIERKASAFLDIGLQAGVSKRSLSGTNYKTGFAWQANVEISLIPRILMLGPYLMFDMKPTPEVTTNDQPAGVPFRALGLRAKLTIPIPGDIRPYVVAGAGWVHADFPAQKLTVCETPTLCVGQEVPNATANFIEFMLGPGLFIGLADSFGITIEGHWRPSIGYQNDVYQKALEAKSTNAPPPGRNGVAWTGMIGLALSF